ncbi:hypothetical protein D5086_013430 [Populus alba]|uniref:Uncharacterized protein n=1 Tax=Populus alba TaxID=43335 RepID=A0ACC4C6H6_POPAL
MHFLITRGLTNVKVISFPKLLLSSNIHNHQSHGNAIQKPFLCSYVSAWGKHSVLLLSAFEAFNFSPVKDVSAKSAFWLTLQLSVAVLQSKPIIVMESVFGI